MGTGRFFKFNGYGDEKPYYGEVAEVSFNQLVVGDVVEAKVVEGESILRRAIFIKKPEWGVDGLWEEMKYFTEVDAEGNPV